MYNKGSRLGYELFDLLDGRTLEKLVKSLLSVRGLENMEFAGGMIDAIGESNGLFTKFDVSGREDE